MRLELASYPVLEIQFSSETKLEDGVLYVDRAALRELVMQDGDFADVAIEVVRPGDPVRIIHVVDAVEPRYKPAGSTFPGLVGPAATVGEGRTNRLAGVAVVSVSPAVAGEPTYWREAIIDMAGPGAVACPLGSTVNLVLHFTPAPSYLDAERPEAVLRNIMIGSQLAQEYGRKLRVAQLRAAAYLAQATASLEPADLRVYELSPGRPDLPRVGYLLQLSGLLLYGESTESMPPRVIHPNEMLDGALLNIRSNAHAAFRSSSYLTQHHAVIRELYDRDGADLSFAGVIIFPNAADDLEKKERMADSVLKLAQELGAHAVLSSYAGGGHPCIEFMLIAQKCERAGIKTVQIMPEAYGLPEDPGFVHFVPEAVAIVSTGRSTQEIELPAVSRVIGGETFYDLAGSPAGKLKIEYRYLYGCTTNTGNGVLTGRQY